MSLRFFHPCTRIARILVKVAAACLLATARQPALGADAASNATASTLAHYNLGADKLALKGYDPVGYFAQNAALKGRKEISAPHRGVIYYFASKENKKLFAESPDKYLPTYGSWCATAMAKGEKVEIDPTNFKVTNGRLFLFFKAFYANALKDWNKDETGQTAKADANWKKISGE
ncbi:MAG: YHS domain protein [Verrucomicrobia bacterium]|nr:YHS domain protein [Verrucomicrobiota bacterium]